MSNVSSIDCKSKSETDIILTKKIHNIKNSLFVISGYITIGEYNKALEKISEICDSIAENNYIYITGNSIIDILLQYKTSTAKQHNIELHYINKLPHKFNFSGDEMDFCTALGNALYNAIEACINLSTHTNRYINVKFSLESDNYISVEISNPVEGIVQVENNHINSTKNDNLYHGFGIISMKECVQKYNGKLEFKQKGNIFYVKLVFKN